MIDSFVKYNKQAKAAAVSEAKVLQAHLKMHPEDFTFLNVKWFNLLWIEFFMYWKARGKTLKSVAYLTVPSRAVNFHIYVFNEFGAVHAQIKKQMIKSGILPHPGARHTVWHDRIIHDK